MSTQGKFLFTLRQFLLLISSSVMYRKYKENKDNEYENIIRRQANESKSVAEQEGIVIPKTLDDYVAPSRAGATGTSNSKKFFTLSSNEDDDLGIDVSPSSIFTSPIPHYSFKDDDDHMADMAGDDDEDGYYNESD